VYLALLHRKISVFWLDMREISSYREIDAATQQLGNGGSMPQETTHDPMAHARPSSLVSLLSGWVQQGMESFFATQRILVDVAMRQNFSSACATLVARAHSTLAVTSLPQWEAATFVPAR
jgi:hypothetical protein